MNAQFESITPSFAADTEFAIALKLLPERGEHERNDPFQRPEPVEVALRLRGVQDSPLHD
jgi:hypothetical protein